MDAKFVQSELGLFCTNSSHLLHPLGCLSLQFFEPYGVSTKNLLLNHDF